MKDGKWRYINTKGNFIVHDEYNNKIEVSGKFDYVCDFREGLAEVKKGGEWGICK